MIVGVEPSCLLFKGNCLENQHYIGHVCLGWREGGQLPWAQLIRVMQEVVEASPKIFSHKRIKLVGMGRGAIAHC